MKRCVVLGTLVAAWMFSIGLAAFQQPAQPAEKVIEFDKISDNLYVLKGGTRREHRGFHHCQWRRGGRHEESWMGPADHRQNQDVDRQAGDDHYQHAYARRSCSGNVEFPPTVDVIVQENTKKYMEQASPVYGLQTTRTARRKTSSRRMAAGGCQSGRSKTRGRSAAARSKSIFATLGRLTPAAMHS